MGIPHHQRGLPLWKARWFLPSACCSPYGPQITRRFGACESMYIIPSISIYILYQYSIITQHMYTTQRIDLITVLYTTITSLSNWSQFVSKPTRYRHQAMVKDDLMYIVGGSGINRYGDVWTFHFGTNAAQRL